MLVLGEVQVDDHVLLEQAQEYFIRYLAEGLHFGDQETVRGQHQLRRALRFAAGLLDEEREVDWDLLPHLVQLLHAVVSCESAKRELTTATGL